jgi:hypothetical protein
MEPCIKPIGKMNEVQLNWLVRPPKSDITPQEKRFHEWLDTLSPQLNSYYEQLILQAKILTYLRSGIREVRTFRKAPDYTFFRTVSADTHKPLFPLLAVELTVSKRSTQPFRDPKIHIRKITNQAHIPTAIIYRHEEDIFINKFKALKANSEQEDVDMWLILAKTIKWWRKIYEPSKNQMVA